MRISDWSSDVCSSDLKTRPTVNSSKYSPAIRFARPLDRASMITSTADQRRQDTGVHGPGLKFLAIAGACRISCIAGAAQPESNRSEERRGGKEWVSTGTVRWWPDH